jgi:hypothetical protein
MWMKERKGKKRKDATQAEHAAKNQKKKRSINHINGILTADVLPVYTAAGTV